MMEGVGGEGAVRSPWGVAGAEINFQGTKLTGRPQYLWKGEEGVEVRPETGGVAVTKAPMLKIHPLPLHRILIFFCQSSLPSVVS